MEKFVLDYSAAASFKGLKINFPYLEDGLEYARKNKIKDICVYIDIMCVEEKSKKHEVNFDFLKDMEFIERFDWLVSLTKKSNIEGLYSLSNLKSFRWLPTVDFGIDFSRLPTIELLNIFHKAGLKNLHLTNLKELYIDAIKSEDCEFLSNLKKLELLRIIGTRLTSLKGLEHCSSLKHLTVARCFKLTDAMDTLMKLPNLEHVVIESCKRNDVDKEKLSSKVGYVYIR